MAATKEQMPSYELKLLDDGAELPDNAPAGRNNMYVGLLEPLRVYPNQWAQVAYFKTPTGARNAQKAIMDKKRPIPGGDWDFQVRKVANPDNPTGPKHSVLYAKYIVDVEDAEGGDYDTE